MRGIGSYTTYRRAPERQQDLGLGAAYESETGEIVYIDPKDLVTMASQKESLEHQITSGSVKLETLSDGSFKASSKDEPGFFSKLGDGLVNFFNSDTFKGLTQAGTQFYAMKQETALAKEQANLAERQTALEIERLRAGGGMLPGGQQQGQPLPNWVLPAAIGGGVLILALVMMNKKG